MSIRWSWHVGLNPFSEAFPRLCLGSVQAISVPLNSPPPSPPSRPCTRAPGRSTETFHCSFILHSWFISLFRVGLHRLELPPPPDRLVGFAPVVVEPHEPVQGLDPADLGLPSDIRSPLSQPLVALYEQRLGLGTFLLSEERFAEHRPGEYGRRPGVKFLLFAEGHASHSTRSASIHFFCSNSDNPNDDQFAGVWQRLGARATPPPTASHFRRQASARLYCFSRSWRSIKAPTIGPACGSTNCCFSTPQAACWNNGSACSSLPAAR